MVLHYFPIFFLIEHSSIIQACPNYLLVHSPNNVLNPQILLPVSNFSTCSALDVELRSRKLNYLNSCHLNINWNVERVKTTNKLELKVVTVCNNLIISLVWGSLMSEGFTRGAETSKYPAINTWESLGNISVNTTEDWAECHNVTLYIDLNNNTMTAWFLDW